MCEPEGGLEAPVGVINAKDLLAAMLDERDVGLRELARPLVRVPEAIEIDEWIRRDGDSVTVEGMAPLRMVERELGLEISDAHEATIGGYLLEELGHVPQVGEALDLGGMRVEVLGVEGAQVAELRIERALTP